MANINPDDTKEPIESAQSSEVPQGNQDGHLADTEGVKALSSKADNPSPKIIGFTLRPMTFCKNCYFQAPATVHTFGPNSIECFLWPCAGCGSSKTVIRLFTEADDEGNDLVKKSEGLK